MANFSGPYCEAGMVILRDACHMVFNTSFHRWDERHRTRPLKLGMCDRTNFGGFVIDTNMHGPEYFAGPATDNRGSSLDGPRVLTRTRAYTVWPYR